MNLDFLSVGGPVSAPVEGGPDDGLEPPIARSPMEQSTRADGAVFEVRAGWNVATRYGAGPEQEAEACRRAAGWADVSHLGKLELQAPADQLGRVVAGAAGGVEPELGTATWTDDAWWCPLTPTRLLLVCEPGKRADLKARLDEAAAGSERAGVVDVTSNFAAITIAGPRAREVFARFSALDLRPSRTPVRALRPGSVGRQPAVLIREAQERYLFLFGWATGEYVWSIVADAGRHLGGAPIGIDALARLPGAGGDRTVGEAIGA